MGNTPEKGLVLIVDDNAANRHLLNAIVTKAGYTVQQCENGMECVEFCDRTRPQIILLDVMMPVMDGIQACQRVRETYGKEELPIIMVTTRVSGSDVAAGFAAGASDYVTKPVDRHVLMTRIENQLRVVQSQKNLFQATKRMEQGLQLQQALGDALPQAIFVHDKMGKVLYQNQSLFLVSGGREFSSAHEIFRYLYNGSLPDLLGKERLERLFVDVNDFEQEFKLPCLGEERHIMMTSRPVLLGDQESLRLWVFRDVTRERDLEKRMNQQVKMETVGLFASGVAHNFNNIFASISGATEILKRAIGKPERIERCVRIFEQAVLSGTQLTKKMYTAKSHLKRKGSSGLSLLGESVQSCWDEIVQAYPEKVITFDIDERLFDLMVAIPSAGLEAIFSNIFENSLEAIENTGTVSCLIDVIDEESGKVDFYISDSGTGMDANTQSKVYEPFFSTRKLDHTNNVSVEGKGLGLWNVYNMIKLAGGDISLESALGKGTTVRLSLPMLIETEVRELEVRELLDSDDQESESEHEGAPLSLKD